MRLRPPRRDDAAAVVAVVRARDVANIGRPDYTMEDLLAEWELPDLDWDRDQFVVEDDDATIIAYADIDAGGARVSIHPDHEDRGVGTLLRTAVEARMREMGIRVRQVIVPTNPAAVEHLRAAGWERVQVFKRMRGQIADAPPPLAVPARRFDLAT